MKGGSELKPVKENLIDLVWGEARPPRPREKVRVLGLEYSGKKFEEKLEDLRRDLAKRKSLGFVVCKSSAKYNLRASLKLNSYAG